MTNFFQRFFRKLSGNGGAHPAAVSFIEESIPVDLVGNYSAVISRVIPYFSQLNEPNKKRFLDRVYNFRRIKSFHFHAVEPAEEIAILVSAAAVQVSFGLRYY